MSAKKEQQVNGEAFHIVFDWGNRPESLDGCISKCGTLLQRLANISPLTSQWYHSGKWPEDGEKFKVDPTDDSLRKWIVRSVNRRDDNKEIIPELGYDFNVWNAGSGETYVNLRVHCGVYECDPVRNQCRVDFTVPQGEPNDLLHLVTLLKVFEIVVKIWNPEKGVFGSFQLMQAIPGLKFHAGWLTYFPDNVRLGEDLKSVVRVEAIDGFGHVVIAAEGPFSSSDNIQVQAVRQVFKLVLAT